MPGDLLDLHRNRLRSRCLARRRPIVLLPTVIGAVLLGLFTIDLGWSTIDVAAKATLSGYFGVLSSARTIRFAIDLAGIALAGGLFIVPAFAAVQAWAGADRRARVVAAVNVLNAAFMAGSALIVAVLQKSGMTPSQLFLALGAGSLAVAVAVGRTMPASALLSDALSIVYRALFKSRCTGSSISMTPGRNLIIALNHVSLLDAGLAMSLRNRKPVFAMNVTVARKWWVRPFLSPRARAAADPLKPMAVRTLIEAVRAGEALIIFPEGRITVTGSLMKVYDGAGMIADKSNAEIVPVRIEGLEQTPFGRLSKAQVRRRWLPKVKVTILEPVRLAVDPDLKGRKRRQAAGAALYGIMSDLVFRTTSTDRTVLQAVVQAAQTHGHNQVAIEDPVTGALTYKRLLTAAAVLGAKLMPLAGPGKPLGVMLPNANGAVVTILGLMSAGRVPGNDQFYRGCGQHPCGLPGGKTRHHPHLSRLHREGASSVQAHCRHRKARFKIVYLEDIRADRRPSSDKIRGPA